MQAGPAYSHEEMAGLSPEKNGLPYPSLSVPFHDDLRLDVASIEPGAAALAVQRLVVVIGTAHQQPNLRLGHAPMKQKEAGIRAEETTRQDDKGCCQAHGQGPSDPPR